MNLPPILNDAPMYKSCSKGDIKRYDAVN